ncbi:hypothetical protein EB796_023910 [Bugula neritina]|uniref:Uncharacterized protein n=1 Tax=Bugula neritina TaxID=10212 RepID=A0A7J7IV40_BUGNE|nr:hypothetical protein EB796_023910 [Bugula neritina]
MDYTLEDDIPPPLDDISSAGGTEGDLEDYDLDSANLNPFANASATQKHYKSFQPTITLKPTDVIYREEHSRAAPRKGIEPKAFLTIGETKPETAEYVGRPAQPVTAPVQNLNRQAASASTRKYTHQNTQKHTGMHSAPANNRNKSRLSRGASSKGRNSAWSSAAYTPLPVAPPPVLPLKDNNYVLHPFKQDTSHSFRNDLYARRPLSPSEDLKHATILATMEVGKFINKREKTPKFTQFRQPKLLKARLRPLNTVNIQGPGISQCQGIQADDRRLGPSPMRVKQQKKLDDMIKKNAAIKDMSSANYGSRYALQFKFLQSL